MRKTTRKPQNRLYLDEIRSKDPAEMNLERYQVQELSVLYNGLLLKRLLTHCLQEINVSSLLLLEAMKYGDMRCPASVLEGKQR